MISLKDIKKIYKTKNGDLTAVNGVDLNIRQGEIFGIIGYSGAGKSTMIRLLNGLEKPSTGTVTINGHEISSSKGAELRAMRQKISMIFQHFNLLWSRTVAENIEFPLEIAGVPKEERKKRVDELIDLVGLFGRGNAYPSQLSGGQKQRVGIARALANNPEVLLCDEATSALDPETTDAILDLLLDINKRLNLTIVLITHEMHVIQKICDRVAVMEAGKVVEMGDVLQVFQSPQQKITKRFVSQVSGEDQTKEAIRELNKSYRSGKLIKITFVGEQTNEPVISQMMKKFPIDANIVHGSIQHTQSGPYGTLIVHLEGGVQDVQAAIQFLTDSNLQAEVVSND